MIYFPLEVCKSHKLSVTYIDLSIHLTLLVIFRNLQTYMNGHKLCLLHLLQPLQKLMLDPLRQLLYLSH